MSLKAYAVGGVLSAFLWVAVYGAVLGGYHLVHSVEPASLTRTLFTLPG